MNRKSIQHASSLRFSCSPLIYLSCECIDRRLRICWKTRPEPRPGPCLPGEDYAKNSQEERAERRLQPGLQGQELFFVHGEPFIPGRDSGGAITHRSISKDPDLIIHLPHSPQQPLSTFPLLPSSTICSFCRHGLDGPPRVHLDLRYTPFQSAIQCSSTHHPEPPVRGIQCYPVCNGVQINRHCVMMPTGEHLPQNLKVDRYDIRLHYSDFFFPSPVLRHPSSLAFSRSLSSLPPPLPFYFFFLLYSISSLLPLLYAHSLQMWALVQVDPAALCSLSL